MTQFAQSARKPFWPLALEALAAVGAGVMVSNWGFSIPQQLGYILRLQSSADTNVWMLVLVTMVLVAIAVPVVAQSLPTMVRSGGWVIAGAGLLIVTVAVHFGMAGDGQTGQLLAALGIGLTLGGTMLAAGAADGNGRLAIGVGFTVGVVSFPWVLHMLTKLAGRELFAQISPGVLHLAVTTLLALAAGVVTVQRHQDAVTETPGSPTYGFGICVLIASAVTWAGTALLTITADAIRLSPDGIATSKRAYASEFVQRYGSAALAVLIGVILLWLAYRRGRVDAARWVVLGFALAGPIVAALHFGVTAQWPVVQVLVGLVAIAAAAVLVVRADRVAPWDAVGAAIVALAMLLGAPVLLRELPDGHTNVALLATFGIGFALSAGLVRLLRSTSDEPAAAASFALLGFAAIVLCGHALTYPVLMDQLSRPDYGRVALLPPALVLSGAVVLTLLFGLRRAIERLRNHIVTEAHRE